MDCGPTCLRMISTHYGKHHHPDKLRQYTGFGKGGVNMLGLSQTAEKIGFVTQGAKLSFEKLLCVPLPAILHWNQNHFVVLMSLTRQHAKVADPAQGVLKFQIKDFKTSWMSSSRTEDGHEDGNNGSVLLLEPSADFYSYPDEEQQHFDLKFVTGYLKQSRYQLLIIFITLIFSSGLMLIFPFLTRSVVDKGIQHKNLNHITLLLIAQLTLSISSTLVEFIRGRLQLKVSNRIDLAILKDFWAKLSRLPIAYFNSRQTGDTLQRIADNRKIQEMLTGQAMSGLFAIINFGVYSAVLVCYNKRLFFIFLGGTLVHFLWISLFFKIRRKINYQTFNLMAKENNTTLQMVHGMQEIKLNNAEDFKRREWHNIQEAVFKLNFKGFNYAQYQNVGALFLAQAKDIIISFIAAQLVINGEITLGMMLAVQFIIGQLNGPVSQFAGLSQQLQDARMSLERLNDIHRLEDEEPEKRTMMRRLPACKSIYLKNLSFAYPGAGENPVLNIHRLCVPEGKTTAIVGVSGSGKTTLLKLLIKIFESYDGVIRIGDTDLKVLSHAHWRRNCGTVMQDGFIFDDTIARNIAVGQEYIDDKLLKESCRVANILPFIESLPHRFQTRLGSDGMGLSQGQRQRILIARAVYKQPPYLFFDEATSALDANNEKEIVEQLQRFSRGRTTMIIAHRLSTVKNADHIVVLNNGAVAEQGTHQELITLKKQYYKLVRNQLELGS